MITPASREGPWVALATLCDQVIVAKDNTFTIVRMIDRWLIADHPTGDLASEPHVATCVLALQLRSGGAQGQYEVHLRLERPDGVTEEPIVLYVLFEGEERFYSFAEQIRWELSMKGLYWLDVLLSPGPEGESTLLTRVPLRVVLTAIRGPRSH